MTRNEHIAEFAAVIWGWYETHKRALPWRDLDIADDTERAYRVLVSEIMLQQTQVLRVITSYQEFLKQFPTIDALATATNRDVILAWRGLGYNTRALRLRDAARVVVTGSKLQVPGSQSATWNMEPGTFPREMDALLRLPGIGHYTAAAVRNFAWNLPTPCLDTNIRRVLHRAFVGPESAAGKWQKDDQYLLKLAADVLEAALAIEGQQHDARNWHAALMDFGSLVCTKTNPKWDLCPLTKQKLMKAANRVPSGRRRGVPSGRLYRGERKREPGRVIGRAYVPNRIVRGRIVEVLRNAPAGLRAPEIGARVCADWSPKEHRDWLELLLQKLMRDQLLHKLHGRYALCD